MTKTEHKEYLNSQHWQEIRKIKIEEVGGKCERCELPRWLAELIYDQDLHVHHLTYANKGAETSEDLQVLCRRCHEVVTFGRSELKAPKEAKCEACAEKHWNYRSSLCGMCESVFISEGFSERLGVSDPTYPEHFTLKFWHSAARSIAYMACRKTGPTIQEVLMFIADTHSRASISYVSGRNPNDTIVEFEAALSLVGFGVGGWEEEEE